MTCCNRVVVDFPLKKLRKAPWNNLHRGYNIVECIVYVCGLVKNKPKAQKTYDEISNDVLEQNNIDTRKQIV